ncbi:CDP-glycerol glycerophosphotransferase family protein [Cellulomonas massiliensis]|uniref:CDP-glycerol glycerophosphotransferase family protein n=1 Tax=Cellulomonas massiliensis TaxID=1465811 RepID=UPI0002F21EB8|nr:CDP-glycerol glycerophosphotransferase family protein [Cellulomonas massiliensis]
MTRSAPPFTAGSSGSFGTAARSFVRRARAQGGTLVRRLGWLPAGMPDGLGEDAGTLERRYPQRVLLYFAGTVQNAYQLRQWYEPLRALDDAVGVVVGVADSRVAALARREQGLPVVSLVRSASIEAFVERNDVAVVCYVGHDVGNVNALRVPGALHVFLSHGESDKRVAASNLVKAYDYAFVAGEAAVERYARALLRFDPAGRVVPVGRPQLDGLVTGERRRDDAEALTVLYAPTWEGGQGSASYSSLLAMGERVVSGLLEDPRISVVYRPHPRTGVSDARYAAADARVRALLEAAGARGRVDAAPDPYGAFDQADVLVADVSAITFDWLATGRPLLVTDPGSPAEAVPTRLMQEVRRLATPDLQDVAGAVRSELAEPEGAVRRAELVQHYFGSVGDATSRFVAECRRVVAERDALRPEGASRD